MAAAFTFAEIIRQSIVTSINPEPDPNTDQRSVDLADTMAGLVDNYGLEKLVASLADEYHILIETGQATLQSTVQDVIDLVIAISTSAYGND